jgi:chromosome segregation ATPase
MREKPMSNEIKNEFKDFITILSTEICKEILLEELEKINTSFNNTSNKYSDLYKNYKSSIEQIKEELIKLDNANKTINNYTTSVNSNTSKINEALSLINKNQEKSLENIIQNNAKALSKYSANVQQLNKSERDMFIKSLIANLSKHSENYVKELQEVFNGSEIKKFFNNTEDIIKKLDSTRSNINSLGKEIVNIENNIKLKNEEESKQIIEKLDEKTKQLDREIQTTKNKMISNIEEVNTKIDNLTRENDMIKKLNMGIIAITILILLFK